MKVQVGKLLVFPRTIPHHYHYRYDDMKNHHIAVPLVGLVNSKCSLVETGKRKEKLSLTDFVAAVSTGSAANEARHDS